MHRNLPSARCALGVVTTLALAAAAASQASALVGPTGDTAAQAIPLSLDTPLSDTTVGKSSDYTVASGAASNSTGKDVVYSFTAPASGAFFFRVETFPQIVSTNAHVIPAVSDWILYATDTTLPLNGGTVTSTLAQADFTGFRAEEIRVTLTGGQNIFLVVDQNDGSPDGLFTVLASRLRDDAEANSTPTAASIVRSPSRGVASGGGQNGDVDFFALGTPSQANSRVFAMIEALATVSPDFEMRITTASDTLEYDDDDGDAMHSGASVQGTLPGNVTVSGTAPVIAGAVAPASPIFVRVNHFNSSGEYNLHAVVQPPIASAQSETESNDDTASANLGSSYFSGNIAPAGEVDVFKVGAHATGDVIFAALDCNPARANGAVALDAGLELLDSAGNVIISVDGNSVNSADVTPSSATLTGVTPESPGEGLVFVAPDATNLFVRVKGINSTTGAYLLSIAINGNRPQIYLDQSLFGFSGTTAGVASAEQTVTVTGRALGASNVTVTVTTDFEVATSSGGTFLSSVVLTPSGGTMNQQVFVRYKPASSVSPSVGTISISVTDGASDSAALRGDLPTITATSIPLATFKSTGVGTASATQQFLAAGIALASSPLDITASANFQVSTGTAFASSLSLAPDVHGDVQPTVINVRYLPASAGPHTGTITLSSANPNAASVQIPVSGRIPTITVNPVALSGFSAAVGHSSNPQTFTLTASQLDANEGVTITAPAHFQVRLGGSGSFLTTVSLTANGSGAIAATSVEVRFSPTSNGTKTGDVAVHATTSGALDGVVSLTGLASGGGGGGGGGGGCVASERATPAAALPWALAAAAALALRGLRRREARA